VWKNEREKDKAIDNHRQKIVELDRKIEMIKSRIAEENMDPITCEDIVNPAITPCCQNTFEFKSLTSYLIKEKTVCPICRAVLLPEKLIVIDKNGKQEEIETKKQVVTKTKEIYDSKLEALSDILKKMNKSSKIIIASGPTANYKDVLHVIESSTLRMRKLDGNIFVRNKILEEFKTKDLNILYLPAYESGSGLNIVNATDLIFLHKMSDGNMNQVTGRAQRLGRKSPLTIWKILYEDEINRTF
jgi:SNF2 family DNA or RNA helicase